jgi:uncharacterized protein YbjT (DUF2867 family)
MFTVMGVTGQVGGAIARQLLSTSQKIRAIVRDANKGGPWIASGCEIAIADVNDDVSESDALTRAFEGVEAAFVMLPPTFDPSPGFPEAQRAIANLCNALRIAKPGRIVCLSTIGGHVETPNLLSQLHMLEVAMRALPLPIAFVRPAWFMENSSWDIAPARQTGVVPSFLQPLDKPFPMIATRDIGRVAAELLVEPWDGTRVVEIEGPQRISPNQIAGTLAKLLRKEVRMDPVPRGTWESIFRSQGMSNPTPRMQMLDGFNEGWIEFESGESGSRKTATTLEEALELLVK